MQASSTEAEYTSVTSESSSANPMVIAISLNDQRLKLYRGTKLISSSRVSTGKAGHRTPSGVFSILQKRRWHHSNIYNNAPMPFMQRLTWSGVSLHQGHVPNYPASHGCIRLPARSARQLFSTTEVGIQVVITKDAAAPQFITHEKLLRPRPIHLVTLDKDEAMLRLREVDGRPKRWIPLPVKAPPLTKIAFASIVPTLSNLSEPVRTIRLLSPEDASKQLADFEYDLEQLEFYRKKSHEPLRILITRREGREQVLDAQRLLNKLGYDAGEADGYVGRQTRAAIRAFEESKDMKPTGEVTETLIDALYQTAGDGAVPTGHLYVKQGRRNLFDTEISVVDPDKPLGTYLYIALDFNPEDHRTKWVVVAAKEEQGNDARSVMDRIEIPKHVRIRLEKLLTPGSSIIVSDGGLTSETNEYTDFVVLTK